MHPRLSLAAHICASTGPMHESRFRTHRPCRRRTFTPNTFQTPHLFKAPDKTNTPVTSECPLRHLRLHSPHPHPPKTARAHKAQTSRPLRLPLRRRLRHHEQYSLPLRRLCSVSEQHVQEYRRGYDCCGVGTELCCCGCEFTGDSCNLGTGVEWTEGG